MIDARTQLVLVTPIVVDVAPTDLNPYGYAIHQESPADCGNSGRASHQRGDLQ